MASVLLIIRRAVLNSFSDDGYLALREEDAEKLYANLAKWDKSMIGKEFDPYKDTEFHTIR